MPNRLIYSLVLALVGSVHAVSQTHYRLPKGFKVCSREDPMLDGCLKSAIESGFKMLKNGSKELGLYPLDPLHVPVLAIEQGMANPNFRLSIKFINFTAEKHSNVSVTSLKFDLPKLTLQMEVTVPEIELRGDYEMRGKMLVLPVRGNGQAEISIKGTNGMMYVMWEKVRKENGLIYLLPTQVKYKLHMFHFVKFKFKNLFKGNKALSNSLNQALNENWMALVEAFKPGINAFFSSVFTDVSAKVFSVVPFDQILPPSNAI